MFGVGSEIVVSVTNVVLRNLINIKKSTPAVKYSILQTIHKFIFYSLSIFVTKYKFD